MCVERFSGSGFRDSHLHQPGCGGSAGDSPAAGRESVQFDVSENSSNFLGGSPFGAAAF